MNGHSKGAEWERKICESLSLWVTDHTRTDCFWRSATSGGRATLAAKRKGGKKFDAQVGDITAIHERGHLLMQLFKVEAKCWKSLCLEQVLFGKKGFIEEIWYKPLREAAAASCDPLCILKQNRQPPIVLTTRDGEEILRAGAVKPDAFPCVFTFEREGARMFYMQDLLTEIDFNKIRARYG